MCEKGSGVMEYSSTWWVVQPRAPLAMAYVPLISDIIQHSCSFTECPSMQAHAYQKIGNDKEKLNGSFRPTLQTTYSITLRRKGP